MFNNLIESSSHKNELKRRGSFVLYTVASYAIFFVIAGVASIYAYDAHLEDQQFEVVTMMSPVDFAAQPEIRPRQPETPSNGSNRSRSNFDEREIAMASVNRPEVSPKGVSTAPNKNQPIREGITTFITGRDRNAEVGNGSESGGTGWSKTPSNQIVDIVTPPPAPTPKPKPVVISKGVITQGALSLPKPAYPQMARIMHLEGKVSVQVLVDETGKVIAARAVDGHPIFKQVAEAAAYQARFSPTTLSDVPVKVSGVIIYNFVLQ